MNGTVGRLFALVQYINANAQVLSSDLNETPPQSLERAIGALEDILGKSRVGLLNATELLPSPTRLARGPSDIHVPGSEYLRRPLHAFVTSASPSPCDDRDCSPSPPTPRTLVQSPEICPDEAALKTTVSFTPFPRPNNHYRNEVANDCHKNAADISANKTRTRPGQGHGHIPKDTRSSSISKGRRCEVTDHDNGNLERDIDTSKETTPCVEESADLPSASAQRGVKRNPNKPKHPPSPPKPKKAKRPPKSYGEKGKGRDHFSPAELVEVLSETDVHSRVYALQEELDSSSTVRESGGTILIRSTSQPVVSNPLPFCGELIRCARRIRYNQFQGQLNSLQERIDFARYFDIYDAAMQEAKNGQNPDFLARIDAWLRSQGKPFKRLNDLRDRRDTDVTARFLAIHDCDPDFARDGDEMQRRKRIENWRSKGQVWSDYIHEVGLGFLVLIPYDVSHTKCRLNRAEMQLFRELLNSCTPEFELRLQIANEFVTGLRLNARMDTSILPRTLGFFATDKLAGEKPTMLPSNVGANTVTQHQSTNESGVDANSIMTVDPVDNVHQQVGYGHYLDSSELDMLSFADPLPSPNEVEEAFRCLGIP